MRSDRGLCPRRSGVVVVALRLTELLETVDGAQRAALEQDRELLLVKPHQLA